MPRIIAGTNRGQQLKVPKSARPTSDRVRESLMTILENRGYIVDAAVLDLFAGSGAFALECLSRGARSAVAVDASREALSVMSSNVAKTGLNLEAVCAKADTWLSSAVADFDLVFLDPPYDFPDDELAKVLARINPVLVDDGLVVVERDKRSPEPAWPAGFVGEKPRTWGDTTVWSARRD